MTLPDGCLRFGQVGKLSNLCMVELKVMFRICRPKYREEGKVPHHIHRF